MIKVRWSIEKVEKEKKGEEETEVEQQTKGSERQVAKT